MTPPTAPLADTLLPVPPRPRRRGVELAMVAGAVLVCVYGYRTAAFARHATVSAAADRQTAALALLALLAHLVVRLRAPHADPLLLPIAVLLNGLGLVVLHRLDLDAPGRAAAPAQVVWSALGVGLFGLVVWVLRDHRRLERHAYRSAAAALALMVVPIGFPAVNGARIWIRLGSLSLQPAEFAKVLITVFFAAYLAAEGPVLAATGRRPPGPVRGTARTACRAPATRLLRVPRRLPPIPFHRVPRPLGAPRLLRSVRPVLAIWLAGVGVLLLERDLGTSLLFFGAFLVLLYVATGRTGWVAVGLLLAAAGAGAVGALEPHVHGRVQDWLHPFAAIDGGGGPGQLAQSLFAFAAGGALGTGLGQGHSWLVGFAVRSDFVLATFGEELGLAGLTALLLLYAMLVARGYRAALGLADPFGRLLAVGLAALLGLQVFVITGGVTGLIPLTGMAMPFLAQGGSSVVTNWVVVALLVRLSDRARTPRPDPPAPSAQAPEDAPAGADRDLPEPRTLRLSRVAGTGPVRAPRPGSPGSGRLPSRPASATPAGRAGDGLPDTAPPPHPVRPWDAPAAADEPFPPREPFPAPHGGHRADGAGGAAGEGGDR
ncbi:FtsW/RodA/SpoVE family cell cycle protein [Streptomyces sp. NPDC059740]|uniref:FtsW/RodA/SpoVE family cell cycle protein n=1 Tax=Streptomyces sp. NPDC059740 TaxID=3346926 RepID=UPI00365F0FA4